MGWGGGGVGGGGWGGGRLFIGAQVSVMHFTVVVAVFCLASFLQPAFLCDFGLGWVNSA